MQKITSSSNSAEDYFGDFVRHKGTRAFFGAQGNPVVGIGIVGKSFEFSLKDGTWSEQDVLTGVDDVAFDDNYGYSVAFEDDFLMVSAPSDDEFGLNAGTIYVYRSGANGWELEQKILPNDINSGNFGVDVELYNGKIVAGSSGDFNRRGSVYVYAKVGEEWVEVQMIEPDDEIQTAFFGESIDVSGDYLVVGARGSDEACSTLLSCNVDSECGEGEYCYLGYNECVREICSSGSVYVYEYSGGSWMLKQKIISEDISEGDRFGAKVEMDGDLLVISAPNDDDDISNSGSLYVYRLSAGEYVFEQKLTMSDPQASNLFGKSLDVDVDIIVAGTEQKTIDGLFRAGQVYIYRFHEGVWVEEKILRASDYDDREFFGSSLSLERGSLLVGASAADLGGITDVGAVYYFEETNTVGCIVDSDCDNGLYCDGFESCVGGSCINGAVIDCGTRTCDEELDSCVESCVPVDAVDAARAAYESGDLTIEEYSGVVVGYLENPSQYNPLSQSESTIHPTVFVSSK